MLFLTNPRKRRKSAHRRRRNPRFRKGSAAAKRYMASIRPGGTVARRRRRRRTASNPHRRRRHHRRNPVARHRTRRRSYRRNPFGFSIPNLRTGLMNGLGVLGGRLGSRALPDMLGVGNMIANSAMTSATATIALAGIQLASGVLLAGLVRGRYGEFILAGTFDGVAEDIGTSFFPNTTFPGKYLGSYSRPLNLAASAAVRGYSNSPSVNTGRQRNPGSATLGRVGAAALRRIGVGAAARVAR